MDIPRERIRELIPHRYPFLFLDAVTAYEPGQSIEGYKLVSVNEPFFQGHFPGNPVMPGVIIIEALAQLGCVFMVLEAGGDPEGKTPLFLGIDKAKFRSMVQPGMKLDLRLEVIVLRRGHAKVNAVATVDGAVAAQAELGLMLK